MAQQEVRFYIISLAPGILLFYFVSRIAQPNDKVAAFQNYCASKKSNMHYCNQIQRLKHGEKKYC